jgi:hypothetical protein
MRRTPALLLLAAVLAGCGGKTPTTPEDAVRGTLTRFADAVEGKDYGTLCTSVFAPNLVDALQEVGLTCKATMEKGFADVRSPQLSVDQVKVSGDKASARVRTSALDQPTSSDTVQLEKFKGSGWRITQLGTAGSAPGT